MDIDTGRWSLGVDIDSILTTSNTSITTGIGGRPVRNAANVVEVAISVQVEAAPQFFLLVVIVVVIAVVVGVIAVVIAVVVVIVVVGPFRKAGGVGADGQGSAGLDGLEELGVGKAFGASARSSH